MASSGDILPTVLATLYVPPGTGAVRWLQQLTPAHGSAADSLLLLGWLSTSEPSADATHTVR